MTLPAFAAERRRLQHGARSALAAIDRHVLSTERSAANSPAAVAAVDRRDRRTDGRTPDRYADPAVHILCRRRQQVHTQLLQTFARTLTSTYTSCSLAADTAN